MKFEDQISYIVDNFDFEQIITYLRVIGRDKFNEEFDANFLKEKAKEMLEQAWNSNDDVEAYNMTALKKGDFLELVFTPIRTNVLRKFFNNE